MQTHYVTNPIEIIKEIGEILIWLSFIISVILAYFYYLKFRNKERSLLIEKGVDLTKIEKRKFPGFLIGFTLLGIGIGFFLGLSNLPIFPIEATTVIFGGIGLIVGHILDKKN